VAEGFVDGAAGDPPAPAPKASPRKEDEEGGPWESEVVVRRLGGARLPVEVLVQWSDGSETREAWDGKDRWQRFRYAGQKKIVRAVVDPERKLALDVDPANNSWVDEKGVARRAASKWSARFLFWLQNLMELHMVLG
jgi:hypothetical protein